MYRPKYQDYSDFLRSKKIATTINANSGADETKFRALTAYDSYDPNLVRQTGIVTNDYNRTDEKPNDTFAAAQYSGRKFAYFNRNTSSGGGGGGVITLDFTNKIVAPSGACYLLYTISTPTTSITFKYTNLSNSFTPEIDSDTFNFQSDNSTLSINGTNVGVEFDSPFLSTSTTAQCIYSRSLISNGDTLTLNTNSPISGTLYVGYYF